MICFFFLLLFFLLLRSMNILSLKLFKILLNVTIIIGIIRIFTFYFQLKTPLLTGLFQYNSGEMTEASGVSYRFSGLDYAATIGVPALFALYVYKKKLNLLFLLVLLAFVFLSGGRTIMIGVIIAIVIFSFLFLPKNFIYMTLSRRYIIYLSNDFPSADFFRRTVGEAFNNKRKRIYGAGSLERHGLVFRF